MLTRGGGSDRSAGRGRVRSDGALRSVRRARDDLFRDGVVRGGAAALIARDADAAAWSGFLGVGDPVSGAAATARACGRLRRITRGGTHGQPRSAESSSEWVRRAIAPRNIGGFAEPSRRQSLSRGPRLCSSTGTTLLGMTRDQRRCAGAARACEGCRRSRRSPDGRAGDRSISRSGRRSPARGTPGAALNAVGQRPALIGREADQRLTMR